MEQTMKRISKEEARDKYGVVINQPGDNNIYWLIETDKDIKVVDYEHHGKIKFDIAQ